MLTREATESMNAKPHPRREKDRHHLATAVSALLATAILLGIYVVVPQ
jgi:hypothetical protein